MNTLSESAVSNLIKSIENVDHEDFTIVTKENEKGEGFIADVLFVTSVNKRTQETKYLTIKQLKSVEDKEFLEWSNGPFDNEIHFYDTVWPTMQKMYSERTGKMLSFVPKCLALSKRDVKRIVMEDLKVMGFKIKHISHLFTKEEFTRIFTLYGIFHGISMSIKNQNSELFSRLLEGIKTIQIFTENEFHTSNFLRSIHEIKSFFDSENERDVINKLLEYEENGQKLIYAALFGERVSRTIIHGDCWSNNFMFKYNDRLQLEDIRIIDYQFIGAGSPVHDLSYLLYSSGVNQDYQDLDYYLKVYHSSLSETLKLFDLDTESIYSSDLLKMEWKKYSKFGFAMGLLTWKLKTANSEKVTDFIDLETMPSDMDKYKQRVRDLVIHFYNNDFL